MAVDLPSAEIGSFLAEGPPALAFARIEARIAAMPASDQAGLRATVLAALEGQLRQPPIDRELLMALFAASAPYLRAEAGEAPATVVHRRDQLCAIAEAGLAAFDAETRVAVFETMLPALPDISLACLLVRKGPDGQSALFGAATASVAAALQPYVEKLVATGALWRQAVPGAILWFWWSFAEEDRLYAFVKSALRDPAGLSALLDLVVEPGDGYDVIAVRRWSKIVDFAGLEQAALQLAMTGAVREDRRRARRFLDAFGNGKSELFR